MTTKKGLISGSLQKHEHGSDKATRKFASCEICGAILKTGREVINGECKRCYWQDKKKDIAGDPSEQDDATELGDPSDSNDNE